MTSDIAEADAQVVETGRLPQPYLLVINIALLRDGGRYWAEPLWAKDLLLHLDFIERLTLFCPVTAKAPPPNWVPVDHPRLTIVAGGAEGRRFFLDLPRTIARLDKAVRQAAIVHTGVGGWPLPRGWIATPLARRHRRFLMIIVESSFWRVPDSASLLKRTIAALKERICRACVNASDLALFTTEQYRRTLATHPRGTTGIAPASWLDNDQLLSVEDAQERWAQKEHRLLFAGRLTTEKGVACLLAALDQSDAPVDIVGDGALIEACRAMADRHPGRVRLLEPVSYGDAFSNLIDRYVAILVPTLSDEQPRVLFDAFARAVPVIASDTAANSEIVGENALGTLVPRGDASALAQAMTSAWRDVDALRATGMRALAFASDHTHRAMHAKRKVLIEEAFRTYAAGESAL